MLYYINMIISEEEAQRITKRILINRVDATFANVIPNFDLNNDEIFKNLISEIEDADIPMPNVIRNKSTGKTYPMIKVSTGVKSLWLMSKFSNEYLFHTCFFGENCYKLVNELAKTYDIYLYDDAGMFSDLEAEEFDGGLFDILNTEFVPWCDVDLNFTGKGYIG